MLVRDAMTGGAETIGPDEPLEAAARRMKDRGVGALVVCEDDRIVGMITDRDIVVRAVANGLDPMQTEVRQAMTAHVVECLHDEELEAAALRMEHGLVRRVVVVDADRRPEGMLSIDDVALKSPVLAGEILERVRAPERPIRRGPWPWWEDAPAVPP